MTLGAYTLFTSISPLGNKFFFKTADIKNLLKVKGVAE